MKLNQNEKNLITIIRDIEFGKVTISIENSTPHRIIKYEKSVLLKHGFQLISLQEKREKQLDK